MHFPRRLLLGLAAFTFPLAFCACGDGDATSTSSAGSAGASGSSGASGAAGTGGSSTTTGSDTGGGGSAGTGGGEPGVPFAYVGTGDGKIGVFALDKQAGTLSPLSSVDAGSNPSFLAFAPDRRTLYAVNEGSDQIASFSIDAASGALTLRNKVSSNGVGPAHVAVDQTGKYVFGVNYGGGNMTMIATMPDGSLGAAAVTLSTGKNAHQIVLDAANQHAFVPNKGADNVSQLVFDAAAGTLVLNAPASAALPGGAGPRHIVFHPTLPYAYVIHENDDAVTAFPYDARKGTLGTPLQTISSLPAGADGSKNTCAEIAFGAGGKYLYGSNRGDDSIVIYSVDASGMMKLVGHQKTGGETPRHFSIEAFGEILLVGNQGSSDVVTFRVDAQTGMLSQLAVTALSAGPGFVGVLYL